MRSDHRVRSLRRGYPNYNASNHQFFPTVSNYVKRLIPAQVGPVLTE